MNHTDEISQLLENIIVCSESIAKVCKLLRKSTETAETPQVIETETATTDISENKEETVANTYTFAEVRKAFSKKSNEGYTEQVRKLIGKYGADRLSNVKESDYPALMSELEAIR
ncbi:MAG: hypothetical protein PUG48_01640 [Clostridia bacterium]|nr:hypothetical protein [Clostridia bacterium]